MASNDDATKVKIENLALEVFLTCTLPGQIMRKTKYTLSFTKNSNLVLSYMLLLPSIESNSILMCMILKSIAGLSHSTLILYPEVCVT